MFAFLGDNLKKGLGDNFEKIIDSEKLGDYYSIIMGGDTHYIVQLALANSMALFDQGTGMLPLTVSVIFELKNRWLNDALMNNFRLIKDVTNQVETNFTRYFHSQNLGKFIRMFHNTDFALSKAEGFGYIRMIHSLHLLWFLLLLITFAIGSIVIFFQVNFVDVINYLGSLYEEIASKTPTLFQWREIIELIDNAEYHLRLPLVPLNILFAIILGVKMAYLAHIQKKNYMFAVGVSLYTAIVFEFVRLDGSIYSLLVYLLFIASALSDLPWIVHDVLCAYSNAIVDKNLFLYILKAVSAIICGCLAAAALFYFLFIINKRLFFIVFSLLILIAISLYIHILVNVMRRVLAFFCDKLHDSQELKQFSYPLNLERAEFANNFDKLRTVRCKLEYLANLLDNRTRLYGDWISSWAKDGNRKKFDNDDIERAIAKLEYESLKAETQSYNTIV